jgi:uncharacterized tellurite resistance protein B-like protein
MLKRRDSGGLPDETPDPRVHWFAEASDAQKQAVVHALLAIATSDGRMSASEKTAIAEACSRLGVSSLDVAGAISRGMPDGVTAPERPEARAALLFDAAAVMVADGRIDDRELAVLLMVGQSLGFTPDQVADVAGRVTNAMATRQRRQACLDRLLSQWPQS